MRRIIFLATSLMGATLFSLPAAAQKEVKFEVLSIRPIQPGVGLSLNTAPTPNGFVARLSLWQAIMLAHVSATYADWPSTQMLNYPKWLGEFYEIDARVAKDDLKAWQSQSSKQELLRSAMRAALKERCKLAIHEQPSDGPNFELIVGKNGPHLLAAVPASTPPRGSKLASGGVMVQEVSNGKQVKYFRGATVADLVWFLNILSSSAPVRDRTSLTGRYDFTLREVEPLTNDGTALDKYPVDTLGLKLRKGTESRPVLVIDHIERPSAN